jgi:hypothetical protein
MSELLAMYAIGFAASAALFGWAEDPASDQLWRGVAICTLWPVTLPFILISTFASTVRAYLP